MSINRIDGDVIELGQIRRRVRVRALWKMAGGFVGGVLAGVLFYYMYWHEHFGGGPELIGLALPGAFALVGLLEFVTGVPFSNWSRRWDSLKGWQRGVLGTLMVLAAFLVLDAVVLIWLEHQK